MVLLCFFLGIFLYMLMRKITRALSGNNNTNSSVGREEVWSSYVSMEEEGAATQNAYL